MGKNDSTDLDPVVCGRVVQPVVICESCVRVSMKVSCSVQAKGRTLRLPGCFARGIRRGKVVDVPVGKGDSPRARGLEKEREGGLSSAKKLQARMISKDIANLSAVTHDPPEVVRS